jgi:membrane protein implicated in regulation of membrane protease activity
MSAFSQGFGALLAAWFGLAFLGTILGYFELVPDPATYWKWVIACIFLAAFAVALRKVIRGRTS